MSNIHENIRAIRLEKGYGQESMAQKLEMSQGAYSNWERDARKLTYNNLEKIADIFGCSVIDIITYPNKWAPIKNSDQEEMTEPLEAILQIRLKRDKREQVLKLVFGENNLEILNK